jgi:uncharacterized protein YeaO (DUF488 family)
MVGIKRVYESPQRADGVRVLVDRLWPRGLSKAQAKIDLWMRDIAPSDALRKWFAHDPVKWSAFQQRYRAELKHKQEPIKQLQQLEQKYGAITLVYAASDSLRNNAVVLAGLLSRRPSSKAIRSL